MSYRIPAETTIGMAVRLNGIWYLIEMTSFAASPMTKIATWQPLLADNKWHFKCINLLEQATTTLGNLGSANVSGIIWDVDQNTGDFWIDHFSVSSMPKTGLYIYIYISFVFV